MAESSITDGSAEFVDEGTTYRVTWCPKDAEQYLEIEMRVGTQWVLCATGAWNLLEGVVLNECPILPPSHVLDRVAELLEAVS